MKALPDPAQTMTAAMRKTLARLPYAEKLRRVVELIDLSRRLQTTKGPNLTARTSAR